MRGQRQLRLDGASLSVPVAGHPRDGLFQDVSAGPFFVLQTRQTPADSGRTIQISWSKGLVMLSLVAQSRGVNQVDEFFSCV